MILPQKHSATGTTIFSVMSALAQEYGAINLSQGFPDFPIDKRLQELLEKATRMDFNQYAPMAGLPVLTEQIIFRHNRLSGINLTHQHITVCPGATYGIFVALSAVLNPGDEVIILEPAYDAYIPAIEMNGGIPVRLRLNFPDFTVDWNKLQTAFTNRTKAIIVNTPHNPTGVVWSADEWNQLAEIVAGKDIIIISDEVYDQIIFDGELHHSVLQQDALKERSIAVFSFGKQFHATGWKVGYTVASEKITQAIRKIHQFLAFSVNTPAQYAIAKFMEQYPDDNFCSTLEHKRNYLLDVMKDTPFRFLRPAAGSYFQIADYSQWKNMSDGEFAQWLIKEVGVAVIPLSSFYQDETDNQLIRFCFSKREDTLTAAAERILSKM